MLASVLVIAAVGLSRLRPMLRVAVLLVILLGWSSAVRGILTNPVRELEPYREVATKLSATVTSDDLVLVHSIPSGVLGIARYMTDAIAVASWVGQLGERRVPADIEALTEGRATVFLVRIHEVGEPAPEESWLRSNATLVGQSRRDAARLSVFRPRTGDRFTWGRVRGSPATSGGP